MIEKKLAPTNLEGVFAFTEHDKEAFANVDNVEVIRRGCELFYRLRPAAPKGRIIIPPKYIVIPEFQPTKKTHPLRGLRRIKAKNYTSNSWAGGDMVQAATWDTAVGEWSLPTVSKPNEPQGASGGWDSSSWVGIDGFNNDGSASNDVLQTGVEQSVDASGVASYIAWWEWFAPKQAGSPPYIFQQNILTVTMSPGDKVQGRVTYSPSVSANGVIQIQNLTTGAAAMFGAAPPPGATTNGDSVEWIMEAPDGGYPTTALPNFTPVNFILCLAYKRDGSMHTIQASDDITDIVDTAGNAVTSTQVSSDNVKISYLD